MNQQNKLFEFSLHFQRSVLSRILLDNKFYTIAIKILSIDHFDTEPFKWIYKRILSNNVRSVNSLVSELKEAKLKEEISEDLRKAVIEEIKNIINNKENSFDDAQYGIDKLKEFKDKQELETGLFNAAVALKNFSDINIVKDNLKKVLLSEESENVITVNLVKHFKTRVKDREDIVKNGKLIFMPTGIKSIDDRIWGNSPGMVWVWFGDSNIGKSCLAVNVGRTAFVSGFRVWHVVLEDKFEMTTQRYDSSLSKIKFNSLTFCNYSDEEKIHMEKIFDILEKKRNEHIYLSKIEEGCNMSDIEAEYKHIKTIYNFSPQVIIIDSPHCMTPVDRQYEERIKAKQTYTEIRKFTRQEQVGMYLFDQSKFETRGKVAGVESFSESYDKIRIADGVITINQTKIQRKDGIVELYVGKMKDREKNFSVLVRPRPDIIRYDSIMEE